MTPTKNAKRKILEFLINRWLSLSQYAALERIFLSSCLIAKENNLPQPEYPEMMIPRPSRQIDIIKAHIIEILPEAKFIDYQFETPIPLDQKDFAEICVADHFQCAGKVKDLMDRMKI